MTVLEALVLGVVQGLTEFLPLSSSAHLVLVPELLGWDQPSLPYLVLLHSATLLALLVYFRRELVALVAGVWRPGPERTLALLLAVATVPAAVIGVVFEEPLEESFGKPAQVAVQLAVTGLILIAAERLRRRDRAGEQALPGSLGAARQLTGSLTWGGAVAIGFAQALAIVPGISRSGATIAAGLVAGLSRSQSARFSFLLSIPILLGTSLFEVPELSRSHPGAAALAAGFIASGVSGYLAIAGMIGFLQKRGLLPFAAYCLIVGGALALVL